MVEWPLTKMKVQMAKTKLRSPDQRYSAHTRLYLDIHEYSPVLTV